MRISDWSSDVCSSDLSPGLPARPGAAAVSARLRPSRFVAQPIAYPDTPSGIVADLIAKRTLGAYRSSIARAIRSWAFSRARICSRPEARTAWQKRDGPALSGAAHPRELGDRKNVRKG